MMSGGLLIMVFAEISQVHGPNGSMDTTTTWKSARWSQWQHGHDRQRLGLPQPLTAA